MISYFDILLLGGIEKREFYFQIYKISLNYAKKTQEISSLVHLFFSYFITGSKKKLVVTLYILPKNLLCQIHEFIGFPLYFSCNNRQQYCQTFCHCITRFSFFPAIIVSSLSSKHLPTVPPRYFQLLTNSLFEILSALVYRCVPKPMSDTLGFYYSGPLLLEPNSVLIIAVS